MEKRVRFQEKSVVHSMCVWMYAYKKARRGEWEQIARDRERFRMRIARTSSIITIALLKKLEKMSIK